MSTGRTDREVVDSLPGMGVGLGAGTGFAVGLGVAGVPGLVPGLCLGAAVGVVAGAAARSLLLSRPSRSHPRQDRGRGRPPLTGGR